MFNMALVLTLRADTQDGTQKLPPLIPPLKEVQVSALLSKPRDLEFLSSCITLSCSEEALDALLCSVFFEPRVTCNLIGAHMVGIQAALTPLMGDPKRLATVMAKRCPRLAVLWPAMIWSGRFSRLLSSASTGLPPVNLPVASWTGTTQSFVQSWYPYWPNTAGDILRAQEYIITFLADPHAHFPFTTSPPFGIVRECNLSLRVREHLKHNHKLSSYRMGYRLQDGTVIFHHVPMRIQPLDIQISEKHSILDLMESSPTLPPEGVHQATSGAIDNDSFEATFNLFGWHRNIEKGAWLDSHIRLEDGTFEDASFHEWILDHSSDEDISEDEGSSHSPVTSQISNWIDVSSTLPYEYEPLNETFY